MYAEKTSVPVERTKSEIERMLMRHKAQQYGTAVDYAVGTARVQFRLHDRIVRFVIALPPQDRISRPRWEQQERQRWRALLLVIKAKLEAVENRIATFEEEFLAHIVMPDDRTVGELALPAVAAAYKTGKMPTMLLTAGGKGND